MYRTTLLVAVVFVSLLTGTAGGAVAGAGVSPTGVDTDAVADGRQPVETTATNASVSDVAGTAPTPVVQTSGGLEIEAAESDDSDEDTLSYTFEVSGNSSDTRSVSVSPDRRTFSSGDVTFEFAGWVDESGGGSGSSTSWTATGGHRYRVEYRVTAESGAAEGTYDISSTAQTSQNTYSARLTTSVDVLEPQFGSMTGEREQVVFDGDSGNDESTDVDVDIPNTGDGVMRVESVSISGEGAGISVSTDGFSNQIDAGDSGSLDLEVEVQDSVAEGTEQFTATVRDNLGNSEDATVEIDVAKVADVSADPDTVDLGGILRGESASGVVTILETAGYDDVDYLEVSSTSDQQGDIDAGDLRGMSIPAGQSRDAQIVASANNNAAQNADLEWDVRIRPDEAQAPQRRFTVTGTVWYPPYFDDVTAPRSSLTFDRPASEVTEFSRTLDVSVRNGGNLPMDLTSVSGSTDAAGVSIEVVDTPAEIPAESSRDATIRVVAEPTAPERAVEVDLTLTGTNPDTESDTTTVTTTVDIEHLAELSLSQETLDLGQLATAQGVTESVNIGERLGYEDVESFDIQQSGPGGGWLRVTDQPTELGAGKSSRLIFDLEFNTSAEYYNTYTWTFDITGENVENRQVTVQATPVVPDTSTTVEQLDQFSGDSGSAGAISESMQGALRQVEEDLLNNASDTPASDLRVVTITGRSSVLFLQATQNASSAIDDGNHSRAQQYVVRAAAAYNTLQRYEPQIQNDELRSMTSDGVSSADTRLADLIAAQSTYYRSQLQAENTTMLEQANIKRELARLASLQGNDSRADQLNDESRQSFQEYIGLVSEGNSKLQAARSQRDTLDSSLFLSIVGQRVFWIGSLDRYSSATQTVLSDYESAATRFGEAGATQQAQSARQERQRIAASYESAYTAALVVAGLLGVLFLVVLGLEMRGIYRYIQDSEASISGDFLV